MIYAHRPVCYNKVYVNRAGNILCMDLEKAFDTVPREMVMATLRWMGVPEVEVRMVEGTYEKTTARVVVGEGASEEFEVNIGLRQGSVLSPLLFIAVLDLISRKTVVKDAMKKLRYATTKAASVREQLGRKNSKSNEGRQAKNGGVKGRDGSPEELDRETGQEQITVGWTRRKDGR